MFASFRPTAFPSDGLFSSYDLSPILKNLCLTPFPIAGKAAYRLCRRHKYRARSSAQRAHINFNIISNPLSFALYVRISIARLRANITPLAKRHITCAKGTNIERATRAYKKGFCCKEISAKSLFLFPQKPLRVFVTGAKRVLSELRCFADYICDAYSIIKRVFFPFCRKTPFATENSFV